MSDFKAPAEQQRKPAVQANSKEEASSSGKLGYVDSRAGSLKLTQLQAAADDQGSRNRLRQLQSKSTQFIETSRIAQLKAKANFSSKPGQIVQQVQEKITPTANANANVQVNSNTELESEADEMGQKAMNVKLASSIAEPVSSAQSKPNPTSQLIVQKIDTLKSSDAQTTAAKDFPVDKPAATAATTSDSILDPTKHPMYATFQARINSVFSQYPPPDGFDVAVVGRNIWTQICSGIGSSNDKFERTPGNNTYSNVDKGYVNMESQGYQTALTEFDSVMNILKSVNNTQFVKAKSYGFWSKPEGREFAEKMTDLTLESSGIGALFDGMPSLNAHQNGWDVQLWGSLSQAFGQAVAKQMTVRGKEVHVCAGGGTDKTNIFGMVESKALEKGAAAIGKSLEEAVTFHSVAAKSKNNRQVDYAVREGSMNLPGTWYSGHSWDDSLSVGKARFDALPA